MGWGAQRSSMETLSVMFSMWTLDSGSLISLQMPSPHALAQPNGRYSFKIIKIFAHLALILMKVNTKKLSSGHFAQRGSHGRRAKAVALSEGRVSHCQTDPQCFSSLYSLYQVHFTKKEFVNISLSVYDSKNTFFFVIELTSAL